MKKQTTKWQKDYIKALIQEVTLEYLTGPQLKKYLAQFPLYEDREQMKAISELKGKKKRKALENIPKIDFTPEWCRQLDIEVRESFQDVGMDKREALRGQAVHMTAKVFNAAFAAGELATCISAIKRIADLLGLDSATKFEVNQKGEFKLDMDELHRSLSGEFNDNVETN